MTQLILRGGSMRYSSHVRRIGFLIVALWALASSAFAADLPVEKAIVTPRPNVSSSSSRCLRFLANATG